MSAAVSSTTYSVGYVVAYTARKHAIDAAEHFAISRCELAEGTAQDMHTIAGVLDRAGAADLAQMVRKGLDGS